METSDDEIKRNFFEKIWNMISQLIALALPEYTI